jgi:hypothetical protein
MNDPLPDPKFFERWFELLAKHKFVAALLPISGIAIGVFLCMSSHVMPHPFSWYVALVGALMIGICAVLFILVAVAFVIKWLRNP